MHSCLLVWVALIFSSSAVLATNYTWTSATDTSWSTPTNWDPAGVPGAGDGVIINPIDDCYATNLCPMDLGGSAHTIASLYVDAASGTQIQKGTLTVTEYSSLAAVAFSSLTITTQGFTQYEGTGNSNTIVSSTWTLQGQTVLDFFDWQLTQSHIINQGVFNVTQATSTSSNDDFDYTKSTFLNSGTVNFWNDDDSRFQYSFTSTGIFNVWTGKFCFFGSDELPAKSLTTSWSGQFNVAPEVTTVMFYTGQHTFFSGGPLVWNAPVQIQFQGADYSSLDMNVTFKHTSPLFIPSLAVSFACAVAFNYDTTIGNFSFTGGVLTGTAPSIIIDSLTGGSDLEGNFPTVFLNQHTTIMSGHDLAGEFSIGNDATIQINGTVEVPITLAWLAYESQSGYILVNPSGIFLLHAFDSDETPRHDFQVPVYLNGRIQAAPPTSGDSCDGNGILMYMEAGGTINGQIDTIDCGNNADGENGDITIGGTTTILAGAKFTGAGSFLFIGTTDVITNDGHTPVKTFTVPYNFTVPVKFFTDVTIVLNHDIHVNNLIWNGGVVSSTTGATLYLDAGTHTVADVYSTSYNQALDGVTLINTGVCDASSANMYSVNGGLMVNNGNMTINSLSFATTQPDVSGTLQCMFTNNKNLIVTDGFTGYVTNNGFMTTPAGGSLNYANDVLAGGTVILTSTSIVELSFYGNAQGFNGGASEVTDSLSWYNADACQFGGQLVIDFVQPAVVPGQQTTKYTPTVGEHYPIISSPVSSGTISICTCAFSSITTIGLDLTKFSVGLKYDASGGIYSTTSIVNVVICAAGDTTCSTVARTTAKAPSCVPVGPTTGGKSTTASGSGTTVHSSTTNSSYVGAGHSIHQNFFVGVIFSVFAAIFMVV